MRNLKGLLIVPWTLAILAVGYWWGLSLPDYDTRISDKTTMSAYEAELFIDSVIAPHQYYLEHPSDQSYATGDSQWQRDIIKEYNRLKNLIKEIK